MTGVRARYAIYWAPRQGTALARFGNGWLGRDPDPDGPRPEFPIAGSPPREWAAAVAQASGYGFHATLKPPFRLTEGRTEAELFSAVDRLAGTMSPARDVVLHLGTIGRFLALLPAGRRREIDFIAATCVETLDGFRAPPDEPELLRRRAAGLSARQEANLLRWGYPHVFGDFRFHMTLSAAMEPRERGRLASVLAAPAAEACRGAVDIADLCVFAQRAHGEPFFLVRRCPMDG